MQIFGELLPEKKQLQSYLKDFKEGRGGLLVYFALLGLILGGIGIGCIFALGHGVTTNTSSQIPWGMQISTYVYFALVSGGCIFTNFFGTVFFHDKYQPVASRVIFIGLITAIAGFAALASELGHVERMYMFILSPNPASPMFWMAVWYTADITILLIEFVNIQRNKHSKAMLYASFIIPVITYCSLGSLFGAVGTIPYYYSALLPVYFLFTGFLAGNALCALIVAIYVKKDHSSHLMRPFRRMQKIALASVAVLTLVRIIIGITNTQSGYVVFRETLLENIVLGVGVSLALPFLILLYKRTTGGLILASLIVLATQFMARLDMVVEAFRVPVFRVYEMPERFSYTPSIFEVLVVVASVSIVTVVYLVAEKTGLFEIAGKETH
jgi:molybdopterin-containing oxidoreductase family membrane subunit